MKSCSSRSRANRDRGVSGKKKHISTKERVNSLLTSQLLHEDRLDVTMSESIDIIARLVNNNNRQIGKGLLSQCIRNPSDIGFALELMGYLNEAQRLKPHDKLSFQDVEEFVHEAEEIARSESISSEKLCLLESIASFCCAFQSETDSPEILIRLVVSMLNSTIVRVQLCGIKLLQQLFPSYQMIQKNKDCLFQQFRLLESGVHIDFLLRNWTFPNKFRFLSLWIIQEFVVSAQKLPKLSQSLPDSSMQLLYHTKDIFLKVKATTDQLDQVDKQKFKVMLSHLRNELVNFAANESRSGFIPDKDCRDIMNGKHIHCIDRQIQNICK
eukprot:964128_1